MQLSLALAYVPSRNLMNNLAVTNEQSKFEKQKEAQKKLRNKALRLLTTREHSREELLRKLEQSRVRAALRTRKRNTIGDGLGDDDASNNDDIEKIVSQLAAEGWQSDDRYADAMVRRLTGQASKKFIGNKLAQAGIKKEAAEAALAPLEQDDIEAATALWNRRFGDTPIDDKERRRQIRYLLIRGFGLGDAFKIVPRAPTQVNTEISENMMFSKKTTKKQCAEATPDAEFVDRQNVALVIPEFVDSVRSSSTWSKSDAKPRGMRSSFGNAKRTAGDTPAPVPRQSSRTLSKTAAPPEPAAISKIAAKRSASALAIETPIDAQTSVEVGSPDFVDSVRSSSTWSKGDPNTKSKRSSFGKSNRTFGAR